MINKKEVGLYIHLPFCKQKCYYCDFTSYACGNEQIAEYIEALKKEIPNNYIIKTIYIGGGTPSYIDSKYIVELMSLVKKEYAKEITIEVNPGTVTKEKLEDYKKCGINRLSIGLQTSDNKLLKQIGRIHTYEDFLYTYKLAREVGFKNVNIDIIFGLPNQIIDETIERIIKLNPEHISTYSLILEEGTKLYNSRNNFKFPSDEEEREMYWKIKNKLEEAGYKHYEISNFAKPGFESKHNLDCWKQKEYIGIGTAAHSYIDNVRYSNTDDIIGYKKVIHEVQTEETKMKEYMLLGLRIIDGINIEEFKQKFKLNPTIIFKNELNNLKNLIEVDGNKIRLTTKGIDLANQVWEKFI